MSTITAFFGSKGSTSPWALPASFSYWPTPGQEKPPKVGDSRIVMSTRVMRASARAAASSEAAPQPLPVQANPLPYKPATLDTSLATLTIHAHETMSGVVTEAGVVPSTDWAWARCTDWAHQTPDPTQICLKDGFD